MTVDYLQLSHMVTPVAASMRPVVSLLEKINKSPRFQYATFNLTSELSPFLVHNKFQNKSAFSCQGQQHTWTAPPQRPIHSLARVNKKMNCLPDFIKLLYSSATLMSYVEYTT